MRTFWELSVQWKHEIKRLVELLLTTDDLRTVQSLTVQLQRALYFHIEQIQRELVDTHRASPNDSTATEVSLSDPCSRLPEPAEDPKHSATEYPIPPTGLAGIWCAPQFLCCELPHSVGVFVEKAPKLSERFFPF